MQAAIAAAGGELPPNLPLKPSYRKVNPADAPILILSLTSTSLPLSQIFDAANTVLAQKIAQVNGVGQVFVGGLLLSQVLTLYTTPVIYLYMDRFGKWLSGGKTDRDLDRDLGKDTTTTGVA